MQGEPRWFLITSPKVPRCLLNLDQGNPQISLLLPAQMRKGLGDGRLQRRPDRTCQKVPASQRTVLQTEHRVQVQAGLSVIALRDVPHQAHDLTLLIDADRLVFLRGQVEPANFGVGERTDSDYRRAVDLFTIGELGDGLGGLLALVEDQDEYALLAF